jgi:hypothetical protein
MGGAVFPFVDEGPDGVGDAVARPVPEGPRAEPGVDDRCDDLDQGPLDDAVAHGRYVQFAGVVVLVDQVERVERRRCVGAVEQRGGQRGQSFAGTVGEMENRRRCDPVFDVVGVDDLPRRGEGC